MSRGFASIGLWRPKFDGNVGGAIRSASAFGAASITIIGGPLRLKAGRIETTDTRASHRHMPVLGYDPSWGSRLVTMAPLGSSVVGVELTEDAVDLATFKHPTAGFYLFGPENGSIPDEVLSQCSSVVKIPTNGCLNLAMAVTVVLYDRAVKCSTK